MTVTFSSMVNSSALMLFLGINVVVLKLVLCTRRISLTWPER